MTNSNYPENRRCGRQVKFWAENEAYCSVKGRFNKFYLCPDHVHLYKHLKNWKIFNMADGETMGCDYETTV